MKFCNHCGNPLKPDARFCGKCGNEIKQINLSHPPIELQNTICQRCGTILVPGNTHCPRCEKSVNISIQTTSSTQFNPQSGATDSKSHKKPNRIRIIVFSAIFLLLGIASTLYITHLNDKRNSTSKRPEYRINKLVDGSTETEIQSSSIIPGKETKIKLKDGSMVIFPAGNNNGTVEFSKCTNYLDFPKNSGFQITGCLRSLIYDNNQLFENNPPKIILPAPQIGNINPVTIRILKIENIKENNQSLKGDGFIIPVIINSEGNIEFTDNVSSYSSASPISLNVKRKLEINEASLLPLPQPLDVDVPLARDKKTGSSGAVNQHRVIYAIITFQSDINWSIDGKLILMKPDIQISNSYRKPWDLSSFNKTTHPITNIYILVHGHNEVEKGGFTSVDNSANSVDSWLVDYKRDVWNSFYKFYLDHLPEPTNPDSDCNLIFEFIYPTYRPIFSATLPNAKENHQTLGEQFGNEINELFEFTPRLRRLIDDKIPFNLYIISHSMGGLVARAGLRYMDQDIYSHFKKLVTWGTPHDGSPLVSMSYVMRSNYNIQVPGIPFSGLVDYAASQKGLQDYLLLDTPGSRDLRVDLVYPVNYWKFFNSKNVQINNSSLTNLNNGTEIYNQNLEIFNANEPITNKDKFVFFYGINNTTFVNNPQVSFIENIQTFMRLTEPQKGTFLLNNLLDPAYNANDGAVPVYSAIGKGLTFQPKSVGIPNCDHEQFYTTQGEAIVKASLMESLDSTKCNCPEIVDLNSSGDTVSGKFKWGIYSEPGKSIKEIKTTLKGRNRFSWKPDGSFLGEVDGSQYSESQQDSIFIYLVDGSIVGTNLGFFLSIEGEWEGTMTYPDGLIKPLHVFFKKLKNISNNLVILYGYYWVKSDNKDVQDEWSFIYPYEIKSNGTIITYSENWLKPEISKFTVNGDNLKISYDALPIKPVYDVNNVELDTKGQIYVRTVVAKRIKRPSNYFPSKEFSSWNEVEKAYNDKIQTQIDNYTKYKTKYENSVVLFK